MYLQSTQKLSNNRRRSLHIHVISGQETLIDSKCYWLSFHWNVSSCLVISTGDIMWQSGSWQQRRGSKWHRNCYLDRAVSSSLWRSLSFLIFINCISKERDNSNSQIWEKLKFTLVCISWPVCTWHIDCCTPADIKSFHFLTITQGRSVTKELAQF